MGKEVTDSSCTHAPVTAVTARGGMGSVEGQVELGRPWKWRGVSAAKVVETYTKVDELLKLAFSCTCVPDGGDGTMTLWVTAWMA